MGSHPSKPGKAETAIRRQLLSSSDDDIAKKNKPAKQLYFGKQMSCLVEYSICDNTSGRPLFLVKTDLSAVRKQSGRESKIMVYAASAVGDTDNVEKVMSITTRKTSRKWGVIFAGGVSCSIRAKSKKRRTMMNMAFENLSTESDADSLQIMWSLKGDKSHQSAVVINTSNGRLIAHMERYSRNLHKHFKNPHAYLLTITSEVDAVYVVALCICLDKYDNASKEKRYARELGKSGRISNGTGSHDADEFGSACF